MTAYDPARDVIVRELCSVQTKSNERVLVRVRRYDHEDGTPGVEKLEVSTWKIKKNGDLKVQRGARLEADEVRVLLATLLDVPPDALACGDDWLARIS